MMAKTFTISMILKFVDQVAKPIAGVQSNMQRLNSTLDSTQKKLGSISAKMNKMGKKLQSQGKELMNAAKWPLAMIGGGVVGVTKIAATYENGLRKIITITGETMQEAESKHGQWARKMAMQTGQRVEDVLEARYQAFSRNVPMEDLDAFVKAALDTAKVGSTTVDVTTKALAVMRNVYTEIDPRRMGNLLAITQKFGGTDISEISEKIGRVGNMALQAGLKAEEMFAVVASGTQTGNIEEVVTGLRGITQAVLKPTQQMTDELNALGITFDKSTIAANGLDAELMKIDAAMKRKYKTEAEMSASSGRLFNDVQAFSQVLSLTSTQGIKIYRDSLNAMRTDTGFMDDTLKRMGVSTTEQTAMMRESFKSLAIDLGTSMMPAINSLMSGLIEIVGNIVAVIKASETLQTVLEVTVASIAAIAAAAWAAGAATWFAGTAMRAFSAAVWIVRKAIIAFRLAAMLLTPAVSFLFSPAGLLIVGIALVAFAIYKMIKNWDSVTAALARFKAGVIGTFKQIPGVIMDGLSWLWNDLPAKMYDLGRNMIGAMMQGLRSLGGAAWDKFEGWAIGSKSGGAWAQKMATLGPSIGAVNAAPIRNISATVDMSGMIVQPQDGKDFGNKAWGALRPKLETEIKNLNTQQKRTGMGD